MMRCVQRADSLLALLVGKADLTGAQRSRIRDRGYALAGSSTLNRLELGTPGVAAEHRYQKIVADPGAQDRLLVDVFLDSHRNRRRCCGWTWMPRTTRCTGRRKGASFTATTGHTVTCHYIFSVGSTCCVRGCDRRIAMGRPAV